MTEERQKLKLGIFKAVSCFSVQQRQTMETVICNVQMLLGFGIIRFSENQEGSSTEQHGKAGQVSAANPFYHWSGPILKPSFFEEDHCSNLRVRDGIFRMISQPV